MREITEVAERLRTVRRARRAFLRRWAIERAMIDPLLNRIADDLELIPADDQDDPPESADQP